MGNLQLGYYWHYIGRATHRVSYFKEFDYLTNNGKVFADDLSAMKVDARNVKELTEDELTSRQEYELTLEKLSELYKSKKHPVDTTQEEVLQQRLVAPALSWDTISGRSVASESIVCRIYPSNIHVWSDFRENVEQYVINDTRLLDLNQLFMQSLTIAETACSNEAEEQGRLIQNLDLTLRKAGIVHSVGRTCRPQGLRGQIDFWVTNETKTVTIICECKATHNLLLPMNANECKAAYDDAFAFGARTCEQSIEWSNVAHPIGQLLRYMVDNDHRYGALTSGTRTYFLKIHKKDDTSDEMVYISDAWFVGEANYLRAWAWVHTLQGFDNNQPSHILPDKWLKSTSTKRNSATYKWKQQQSLRERTCNSNEVKSNTSSEKVCDDSGNQGKSCNMDYFFPLHQGALDYVAEDEIVVVGVLGEGRNGACFKVKWKGTECAMKQFDIGRNGDKLFENELRAYMMLQKAWGVLVPRPLFLSESFSGGIMFLGLQLGRAPTYSDDEMQQFRDVLQQLRTEYGIRHNDAERGRNMIILTDDTDGIGRVAAIDFEDWELVKKRPIETAYGSLVSKRLR